LFIALAILVTLSIGNRVTALNNSDRIFPPMLAAIRGAAVSITFETFVLRDAIGVEAALVRLRDLHSE
jgi:hypothetical protein